MQHELSVFWIAVFSSCRRRTFVIVHDWQAFKRVDEMTQRASILNFVEALRHTYRGAEIIMAKKAERSKQADAKPIKMTKCHDGVYRFLPRPKFETGGYTFEVRF